MQKVIVNGANGYVASHFVSELLKNGFEVVALVRATSHENSEQRMKNALAEIDGFTDYGNLEVFNYNLLEKNYSFGQDQLTEIFRGDVDFFHFAASLKFKKIDKDEIFKTNVHGTKNSLDIFHSYNSEKSRFFYISTAYSCGKTVEPFKEQFYKNESISHFRNYYEQSKRYAENEVEKYIETYKLNAHVIRLSQVVGDSQSGVTKTNYGVFDFIQKLQKFSALFPNEKVRIQIDPNSTQNLIPIDKVVDYLIKLLKKEYLPEVFNFVSRKPLKNNEILESVSRFLPVEVEARKDIDKQELNRKERMIAAGMSFTGDYAKTKLKFDTENLENIISLNGNEISIRSFHRMIEYVVNHNSKTKFSKV